MSDEPRTCAHAHIFTPLLSSFCGSQLPDCVTLHWKLPPLPASLSFQMSYVRHPALRDKDRHSVSKWDLTTSKLSSESRRKGAWGGSTVQWQGRRKTPPPAFMLRVKIDVQWVYENISLFCLCALGGWNIPLCSCHPEDWMFRHHIWITPKQLPYRVWKMINDFVFCHYLQKNMWLSCVEHKIRKKISNVLF